MKHEPERHYITEIEFRLKRIEAPEGTRPNDPIDDPQQVVDLFQDLQAETKERFISIALDAHRRILSFEVIAVGSLNVVYVRPIEILRPGFPWIPQGFIVVHNHPSGNPAPSPADRALTSKLRELVDMLGCRLFDHVIIGADGKYYSFAEDGQL